MITKRIFYQPEYAKEIKLSSIGSLLRKQFDGAVEEVMSIAQKVGEKIAIVGVNGACSGNPLLDVAWSFMTLNSPAIKHCEART